MSLKIVVNVGVGVAVEETLRELGHDVVSVRNIDPRMGDREIVDMAARDGRLVITVDKDFGELVFREETNNAGGVLLRLEEATGAEKAEVVRRVFEEHTDLLRDRFAVYQSGRLRIRSAK